MDIINIYKTTTFKKHILQIRNHLIVHWLSLRLYTRYWPMAQAKLSVPHNALKCLSLPSYVHSQRHKYPRDLPQCYLTTSYCNPNARNPTPNKYNVLQPPLTKELLQSHRKCMREMYARRGKRQTFVAPEVQYDEIAQSIDELRLAEYDGVIEVNCLRGCCLILASKINDKFDVECTTCKHWFHSSCLFKIFRVLKAHI
eukprot:357060_1